MACRCRRTPRSCWRARCVEGETAREGPFGEFTGYYASSPSEQPVVRRRRVYYRNDPILAHRLADAAAVGLLVLANA